MNARPPLAIEEMKSDIIICTHGVYRINHILLEKHLDGLLLNMEIIYRRGVSSNADIEFLNCLYRSSS
jgi:hypothetical protein